MKKEDMYEAISMLRSDLVEEADEKEQKAELKKENGAGEKTAVKNKKRIYLMRYVGIAASACIVFAGIAAYMKMQPKQPQPPTEAPLIITDIDPSGIMPDGYHLEASDIGEMFEQTERDEMLNALTNHYVKISYPILFDPFQSGILPRKFPDYLPVYQKQDISCDQKAFEDFMNLYYEKGREFMGLTPAELMPMIETYGLQDKKLMAGGAVGTGDHRESMYIFERENGLELQITDYSRLRINGEMISLSAEDLDDVIKSELNAFRTKLNEHFGTDFRDIWISRTSGSDQKPLQKVTILLYDKSASTLQNDYFETPMPEEYYKLSFNVNQGAGAIADWEDESEEAAGRLYLTQIIYHRAIQSYDQYLQVQGKAKLLTVEEAEEMLSKGYVFGFHSCPLCMASQPEVDFSEYDAVTLSYISGKNGLTVPFYHFYKKLEQDSQKLNSYAVTHVCAVALDGLEEYFEEQKLNHPSAGIMIKEIQIPDQE